MLEYMFLLIRNLNEIDEWFDNKDIKVNIFVDLNEIFLYEYCVYSLILCLFIFSV